MKRTNLFDQERVVVLEGIDGAGKSTLAAEVAAKIPGAVVCSRRSFNAASPFAARELSQLARLIWEPSDKRHANLLPSSYWLHLQVAWYSLFSREVLFPMLENAEAVVVDGWFYKFLAKLESTGSDSQIATACFDTIFQPSKVILLCIEPHVVWRRRQFTPSEMGLYCDGNIELGEDSFVEYQKRVALALRKRAKSRGWASVTMHANTSLGDAAAQIAAIVSDLLTRPCQLTATTAVR